MEQKDLSPFDVETVVMIGNLLKKETITTVEENYIKIEVLDISDVPEQIIEAVTNAVKGKVNDRFINSEIEGKDLIIRFDYEPVSYPQQIDFDSENPDISGGKSYARKPKTVEAILFDRENLEKVLKFAGKGKAVVPERGLAYIDVFTENNVVLTIVEGQYLINDNGHLYKMSKKEFELDYDV